MTNFFGTSYLALRLYQLISVPPYLFPNLSLHGYEEYFLLEILRIIHRHLFWAVFSEISITNFKNSVLLPPKSGGLQRQDLCAGVRLRGCHIFPWPFPGLPVPYRSLSVPQHFLLTEAVLVSSAAMICKGPQSPELLLKGNLVCKDPWRSLQAEGRQQGSRDKA